MTAHKGTFRLVLAAFCVLFGLHGVALGADRQEKNSKQYNLESKIYTSDVNSVKTTDGKLILATENLKSDKAVSSLEYEQAVTFCGATDLMIGGVHMVMKGDSLTWNGEPFPNYIAVPLLTSPKVMMFSGQESTLQVGTQDIQYFERMQDGFFKLRTKQAFTGYTFTSKITPVEGSSVNVKWTLETHRVKERMPIPGVELAIGVPVIEMRQLDSDVTMKLGDWGCFLYKTGQEVLIVFVRITEAGNGGS